jgi:hypothetical protein
LGITWATYTLSDQAFERIDPLVRELSELDLKVGTAGASFDDNDEARQRLAASQHDAFDLGRRCVHEVRSLLRSSVS